MSFSEPCTLAVDFGGTSIKMGVTAGDRILATADRIPTAMFESPQAIIEAMIAAALFVLMRFGRSWRLHLAPNSYRPKNTKQYYRPEHIFE